jgi:hypothetical protein
MNDEKAIRNAYGSINLPDSDMYSAVLMQLTEPKRHKRKRLKPTVLIVIILAFALSITTVAIPTISNPVEHFPPFYTESGELIDPISSYKYALEQKALKGEDQLFYTREQLEQFWDNGNGITAHMAEIRQPHIHPNPRPLCDGLNVVYIDGIPIHDGFNVPYDLCNNTFYYLHNGRRFCNQCGYVFSMAQDREIGLID